jgi:hypothetical protein
MSSTIASLFALIFAAASAEAAAAALPCSGGVKTSASTPSAYD